MHPPDGSHLTRTCTLWFDGIVRGLFHEGAEVAVEDAKENLEATARLCGGRPRPVLVDLRPARSQSAEARALFAGPGARQVTSAVALLIGSPTSRVLGNFYLSVNRPQTPTRLFTSVAEAETWLATFADPVDGP